MKNLGLSLAFLAGLAAAAAAAPVSSVCSFMTPSGEPAQARFDIENLLVRSSLRIGVTVIPNLQPTCILHPRGGLRCPHADAHRRFELFPFIDDATDKVVGMRAVVSQENGEDALPVEQAVCRPAGS